MLIFTGMCGSDVLSEVNDASEFHTSFQVSKERLWFINSTKAELQIHEVVLRRLRMIESVNVLLLDMTESVMLCIGSEVTEADGT